MKNSKHSLNGSGISKQEKLTQVATFIIASAQPVGKPADCAAFYQRKVNMSKKKSALIIAIICIPLIIIAFLAGIWFQKHSKTDDKNIGIEEINEKAVESVSLLKEASDSQFVTMFDKYSEVELIPNSVESIEDGLYKGRIKITAPNFEEGVNTYAQTNGDDSFSVEQYNVILEEILSNAPTVTSEHEIYLYLNDDSELIPVLDDDIINSMYGNLNHLYQSEFENCFMKGGEEQ